MSGDARIKGGDLIAPVLYRLLLEVILSWFWTGPWIKVFPPRVGPCDWAAYIFHPGPFICPWVDFIKVVFNLSQDRKSVV